MLLALGLRDCTFSSQTLDTVANCSELEEEEAGGSGSGEAGGSGAGDAGGTGAGDAGESGAVGGTALKEQVGGTA